MPLGLAGQPLTAENWQFFDGPSFASNYTVTAVDTSGNWGRSPEYQTRFEDPTPPTPVASLRAEVTADEVRLDWDLGFDLSGVKGYLVHRDGRFIAFVTRPTDFVDLGVEPGPHRYEVRSQNSADVNADPVAVEVVVAG
ncbi:MAG: hypothetical protein OEY23_05555 [Acidimicrobiia bacterium]|nr:hypothetical protein [Acidimicrobiia bacterium]